MKSITRSGHAGADHRGDGQMVVDFTKRMEMLIISSRRTTGELHVV